MVAAVGSPNPIGKAIWKTIPPPPPPPPSPHYASSSPSSGDGDDTGKQYGEKDYEEVYSHFGKYYKGIQQHIIIEGFKSIGVQGLILGYLINNRYILNDPKFRKEIDKAMELRKSEQLVLKSMNESEYGRVAKARNMCFGACCGLASLVTLRWGRRRWGFRRSGKAVPSAGGYKFDQIPKMQGTFDHRLRQTGGAGAVRRGLGWLLDAGLAGILGWGSYFGIRFTGLLSPKPMITAEGGLVGGPWNPDLPLVPGESRTADMFCGPLTEEFRKFPKELWQSGADRGTEDGHNKHPALYANSGWRGTKHSPGGESTAASRTSDGRGVYERLVLDSLQAYVINCERRARHEKQIRKNLSLPESARVIIPLDGVRADEDLELDDIYLIDEDGKQKDGDDGFGI